ncbi:HAMP domain-containing histidine kinase [Parasulfuritortus cantonensis]|uniref:Signal transduction histidine-protein kinase/phosphatase MprB n=1 Tax=Parasulfuritortus cantonensis TaxID=2528202 RepID=A0A4V2NV01_9PROT|nr:HAMP domain-containing sensor histidine kinase [Parasulfuritortus cantonensis]TCJ11536.1 HAMP domain-containing histidine kinase [Parasulfuritortus cantonensis]
MRSLHRWWQVNRLQRKVMLVVLVIIVVPMLATGVATAAWVINRVDASIENWLRESARLNLDWLHGLHDNARLFADLLEEAGREPWPPAPGRPLIPERLRPLATELGIGFVQVYGLDGRRLYSSMPVDTAWTPEAGRDEAVIRINRGDHRQLAAVTVVVLPRGAPARYRMVLGTLFDKPLLQRLGVTSGLKTRLFYPRGEDFAKAFAEEESVPLNLRLPAEAFQRLRDRREYFSPEAEDGTYWGLYTPVLDSNDRVEAILFSGLAHSRGDQILADRSTLTLAIAILGSLLAAGMGLLLSRLVIRPVESLHEGVMRVAAQDFRATIPAAGNDELADLARAFNTMAASLREARDSQQQEFRRDKITALGELSLAMAHEIRNPIGVLNTAAQLLDKAAADPARQADLTRMIREETARLNGLLRDFQQLARHRKPQFQAIAPERPLEAALRLMLAGHPEVELRREYGHGDALIRADPELLQQAWTNLVNNALEAIGAAPARLTLRSWLDGGALYLALEDNGPGVPVERIPRLFEPFYTSKEHGSGLGLTIADTLVEANGGRLQYAPGRAGGAAFMMRFASAPGAE